MWTSAPGSPDRPTPSPRLLVAAGGVGGLVGALMGGGTGTITVPALSHGTKLTRAVVHGTVIVPNALVAIIGSTAYALRGGAVDLHAGVPMMIGGILGVQAGARFVTHVSDRTLTRIFIGILLVVGTQMFLEGAGIQLLPTTDGSSLTSGTSGIVIALILGIIIGAYSAAMGLGGGLLTVPALVLLFGTTMQTALGTSLAVMIPNAILSILAHARQHTLDMRTGLLLAASALPGAVVGAVIALELPGRALSVVFGVFVLFIAAREIPRAKQ